LVIPNLLAGNSLVRDVEPWRGCRGSACLSVPAACGLRAGLTSVFPVCLIGGTVIFGRRKRLAPASMISLREKDPNRSRDQTNRLTAALMGGKWPGRSPRAWLTAEVTIERRSADSFCRSRPCMRGRRLTEAQDMPRTVAMPVPASGCLTKRVVYLPQTCFLTRRICTSTIVVLRGRALTQGTYRRGPS
jgi:hypothetical protein